jgi:hypothetical protein
MRCVGKRQASPVAAKNFPDDSEEVSKLLHADGCISALGDVNFRLVMSRFWETGCYSAWYCTEHRLQPVLDRSQRRVCIWPEGAGCSCNGRTSVLVRIVRKHIPRTDCDLVARRGCNALLQIHSVLAWKGVTMNVRHPTFARHTWQLTRSWQAYF